MLTILIAEWDSVKTAAGGPKSFSDFGETVWKFHSQGLIINDNGSWFRSFTRIEFSLVFFQWKDYSIFFLFKTGPSVSAAGTNYGNSTVSLTIPAVYSTVRNCTFLCFYLNVLEPFLSVRHSRRAFQRHRGTGGQKKKNDRISLGTCNETVSQFLVRRKRRRWKENVRRLRRILSRSFFWKNSSSMVDLHHLFVPATADFRNWLRQKSETWSRPVRCGFLKEAPGFLFFFFLEPNQPANRVALVGTLRRRLIGRETGRRWTNRVQRDGRTRPRASLWRIVAAFSWFLL